MFKLIRSNSIKSISFRSSVKQLTALTNNHQRPVSTAASPLNGSSNMLPINKLAVDVKKRTYSTQQYAPEEITKIRATYEKFDKAGQDFDIPTPWGMV